MPFCPNCKYEYRPDIDKCPDCGERLVEELPVVPPDPGEEELVPIARFLSEIEAEAACATLRTLGIDCMLANRTTPITTAGQRMLFNQGGIKVVVRASDAERALQILGLS